MTIKLMTCQLEFNIEKEDKEKDSIKKLHNSIKQLILFASADDDKSIPKHFMNSETDGIADKELVQKPKASCTALSMGFTQALYNGIFLWSDRSTPSNLSPVCILEMEPLLAVEHQYHHFILHIVQMQGKGGSLEEIKSSNKQGVKAPTTYTKIIQQHKFQQSVYNIHCP